MSNEKAGIIVASVIIVIALIIGVIYMNSKSKDKEPANEVITVTSTVPVSQPATEPVANKSNEPAIKSVMVDVDADSLPVPTVTTEIGVVQAKTIKLIDDELFYSLDLLVGVDNVQLHYLVGKQGYNAVTIGDKCSVELATYITSSGGVYYTLNGVQLIN